MKSLRRPLLVQGLTTPHTHAHLRQVVPGAPAFPGGMSRVLLAGGGSLETMERPGPAAHTALLRSLELPPVGTSACSSCFRPPGTAGCSVQGEVQLPGPGGRAGAPPREAAGPPTRVTLPVSLRAAEETPGCGRLPLSVSRPRKDTRRRERLQAGKGGSTRNQLVSASPWTSSLRTERNSDTVRTEGLG